nr:hypothetical protein [Haloquadratum walsbyi]
MQALDTLTRILLVGQFRLQRSNPLRMLLELLEFWSGVIDGGLPSAGVDTEGIVRAHVMAAVYVVFHD